MRRLLVALIFCAASLISAAAQELIFDQEPKGYAAGVSGNVMILEPEAAAPRPLADSDPIFEGCRITAAEGGFAEIALLDGSLLRVDELTQIDIEKVNIDLEKLFREVDLKLHYGSIFNQVESGYEAGSRFMVTTPVAVAGVRGTEFAVGFEQDDVSAVDVFDGDVAVTTPDGGSAEVSGGERVSAGHGRAEKAEFDWAREQNRWEHCKREVDHGRQGRSVEQLQGRIEELRQSNPDHPSIPGLENALSRQKQNHDQSRQRMEEARQKMRDGSESRRERMKEFSKTHGRGDRFEQARKFRGGRMTPEQCRQHVDRAGGRHEQAKRRLQDKRGEREAKDSEERRRRREGIEQKREDRKDDVQEHKQEKRGEMKEKREEKRGDVKERREEKKENIEQRRDGQKDNLRERRENNQDRRGNAKERRREGPGRKR